MDRILIVSSSETAKTSLIDVLKGAGFLNIDTADSGSEARRRFIDGDADYLLINAPLSDEFGTELAIDLSESSDCGILLLVKAEIADQVQEKVEDFGVFVVPKPINRQVLYQSFKFVEASRKRVIAMKRKNEQLSKKLDDLRVVDQAKCHLIEHMGMTEQQAHRYIEKQAMDSRKPKREIAKEILDTKQP